MTSIKVSSKGQVVIPKAARDALGIGEGQMLDCVVDGGKIMLVPTTKIEKTRHVSELFGILKEFGKDRPATDEEMNAAIDEMFRNDPQWR